MLFISTVTVRYPLKYLPNLKLTLCLKFIPAQEVMVTPDE